MAITRINNNQITDSATGNIYLGVNAAVKLQDYTITAGKIQNNLTYGSDLTITGNLTVQGNTTAIDTVNLVVEDPLILLAKEQTGAPSLDIGFIGKRGTDENIAFVWDESADQFVMVFTDSEITNSIININSYASLQVLDLTAANANITGLTTLTGNLIAGNIFIDGQKTIDVGNSIIGNVQEPIANSDAATKAYVDSVASSGFTIEDDTANTTQVSGGDTLQLLGTANEVTVEITAVDQITFGLPDDVVITGNMDAGNFNATAGITAGTTITATGNITGGNIDTTGQVVATGNVSGGNIITLGVVEATGNVTGGNLNTAGQVVATGNVSGGNITTVGNIDGANINATAGITAGTTIAATGNVSGGNITTVGAVDAVGNVSGGNITTVGAVDAVGNVSGGNLTTGGAVDATGNVSGGNITTAGVVIATGNVSGGNIVTLGNVDANNVNATADVTAVNVLASGNVDGANINTDSIVGTAITITATSVDMNLTGNLNLSGRYINAVADPVAAQDAATKQYVDDAVSAGIHIHTPVDVETPTALPAATYNQGGTTATVTDTIAGNTVVFSTAVNPQPNDQLWFTNSFNGVVANIAYFVVSAPNTSAAVVSTSYDGAPVSNITNGSSLTEPVRINSGFGANLTANTTGALTVDGYSVSAGNRVLVYNQSNAVENGIYIVSDAGNGSAPWILTRSDDANSYIPDSSVGLDEGSYVFVKYGDTGAGESYVMTAPIGPFNIGQAAVTFTQFSASQVYSANTQAGLVLNGTVFSAKVDNDTTAFDGGGNIKVKDGANLVTPNIGDAVGNSLTLTGNGLLSATTVTATGNVSGGNLTTAGDVTTATVTASGNIDGANVNVTSGITAGTTVIATGNITGGNIDTAGQVVATGNITGGNLLTAGVVTATGNVSGGNITTAGAVNATGNITGGNISAGSGLIITTGNVDGGNINVTANVTGAGAVFSGNVVADTFIGNISGNIDAGGANTNIQFNDDDVLSGSAAFTFDKTSNLVTASGNISAGNLITAGSVDATGNVSGGNITTAGNIDGANVNATAGITAGTTVMATGNITGGNIDTAGEITATGNVSGGNINTAGNVNAGNVVATSTGDFGNIRITGNDITNFASNIITINSAASDIDVRISGDSVANLLVTDAGTDTVVIGGGNATTGAALKIDTSDSMMVPVGNTAQRPGTPVLGMFRFNTGGDALEIYTSGGWEDVGVPAFTVITADAFVGNGIETIFTLSSNSTTAATIVSINGIVQEPTTAYAVSGNVLTFTEAPAVSDNIDARILTTTNTITNIENTSGNAVVAAVEGVDTVEITGNLLPAANITYDLGSTTRRWRDGYFSGSSITLGNIVMKNTDGNSIGFFGPDGTTPGSLDANVAVSGPIQSGTSNVSFAAVNGNVQLVADGNIVGVITGTGANITGTFDATGNANVGNLGTAGLITATGNVSGGNITTTGTIIGGNISAGNLLINNDAVISGNLTVLGTETIFNVDTLTVNDKDIIVANNVTGGANVDGAGLRAGNPSVATWLFNNATTSWQSNIAITPSANGTLDLGGTSNRWGNAWVAGNLDVTVISTSGSGNITLAPDGAGVVVINADLRNGQANGVGNIGEVTSQFNTIFARATSAQYADLAEMYEADAEYAPGTVLCFGGLREVTLCNQKDCSRVAGVVSTNPSYLMNSGQTGEHVAAVALTGRVPCRVTGTIRKGDLIVSAGDGRGRANNAARVGTVIGKALADFDGADGVIEVVVGRV